MPSIRTANERHKRQAIAASRHQPKPATAPAVVAKPPKTPLPIKTT